ncbi:MAG: CBS domain-containing protein [Gammaproteobacteria bacterium]|nr:CBS domain-containing protein [Gammaproteobacteria bacterium]
MADKSTTRKAVREDYERALQSMDTFMDIEVNDLMTLAERAQYFAGQRATESLKVSRIMSHPVRVVREQDTMSDAAHLMVTERISGLPVVDNEDRLVGIITEADFLRGLGVPAHHPTHNLWQTLEVLFSHLAHHGELEAPEDPVADHMVRDVVCTSPDQYVDEVIQLMKQHRVKRVLVCSAERRVVGVVTRSDLMRIFFDRYRKEESVIQVDDGTPE